MKSNTTFANPLPLDLAQNKRLAKSMLIIKNAKDKTVTDDKETRRVADAHENLTDIVGEIIWGNIIACKRIPNKKEADAFCETYQIKLKEMGYSDNQIAIVEPKLKTCFDSLINLQEDIEKATTALKSVLPLSAQDLKVETDTLKTETGNAIHCKWQEDYKKAGGTARFKPCLTEADKKDREDLFNTLKDKAEGEKYLKRVYSELKMTEPFETLYRYDENEKIWKENILKIDNAQLQYSNSRENSAAANVSVSLLADFLPGKKEISSQNITSWLLETVGPKTHIEWGKRNKPWRECQKKPFEQLPALEAIRDFQVLTAIDVLTKNKKLAKEPAQEAKATVRIRSSRS